MRIGLIGFGTIGKAVARAVKGGRAGDAEINIVLVRDVRKINSTEAGLLPGKITADPDACQIKKRRRGVRLARESYVPPGLRC